MKKTLLLFITLLSVTFSNAQLAEGATFNDGLLDYVVTADALSVTVTGFNASATVPTNLTIPASVIEGAFTYNVTQVGSDSFVGNTTIETLSIPGTPVILFRSFQNCTSLLTADLAGVTDRINNRAFDGCTSLQTVTAPNLTGTADQFVFEDCPVTSVDLGNVTSVGTQCFLRCDELVSISLPSATLIGNLAFLNCTKLATIDMPVVEQINTGAFNGTGLTSITFPASLTTLIETNFNMFRNITTLTDVIVEGSTPLTLMFEDSADTNSSIFSTSISATLTVPDGTLTAYQAAAVWQDFGAIVESAPLSIDSKEASLGFSFYPNPAKNIVSIENNQLKNAAVTVYDLNGRALLNKTINVSQSEINISNLHSGVYLFNVTTDKGSFVKRIVKQ